MADQENGTGVLGERLGYLLKHAQLQLAAATAEALRPVGLDGRELAVLAVLAAEYPLSQLEVAGRLGLDRTTMVAMLDTLEARGLVERRRSAQDRRKNVVELTEHGRHALDRGEDLRAEVERAYLAPLSPARAGALTDSLRAVVAAWKAPERTP
ncbi:MarR family winged helix-turn-helix transcriptional regulator [Kitasatospora sp. NPDC058965]|uniref:MarR family winged helix-turn-helix transcriptional regulator n=1 Tax=Kitasatospora sp. NPDC058965 TaxID=3346682 RepID=UPI003688D6B9